MIFGYNKMLRTKKFVKEIFSNRNTVVMAFTLTITHFFNNLYLPWWPLYLRELGASIETIGFLFTSFGFFRFLMTFPGGMLADRFGRKKMILFGTTLRIVAPALYLLAKTWQQLIPGLITNALLGLYGPPVYTLVLESLPAKRRTTGFGVTQTILILSSSVTMILGGMLMDNLGLIKGTRLILIAIEISFPIVLFIRYKYLSETLEVKQVKKRTFSPKDLGIRGSILGMLITQCVYWVSMNMYQPFLAIYATDVIDFDKTQWGFIQMVYQLIWAITSVPGGMLADRFGKRTAILLSNAIAPIPLFSYVYLRDFNLLLAVNILAGLGAGLGGVVAGGGPAWQALITDLVPSERRGGVIGLMGASSGVTSAPSSYIGGYLWDNFSPSATILVSAMLSAASATVFLLSVKEPKIQKNLK